MAKCGAGAIGVDASNRKRGASLVCAEAVSPLTMDASLGSSITSSAQKHKKCRVNDKSLGNDGQHCCRLDTTLDHISLETGPKADVHFITG